MLVALSLGRHAQIDDADEALVVGFNWWSRSCCRCSDIYYAYAQRNRQTIYMHRLIIGAKKGEIVDHVNRDGLDNRRSNLRIATIGQNNTNRRILTSPAGYRGVSIQKGRYRAAVYVDGKKINVGCFGSAHEAARAYDAAAIQAYGEFAVLNFLGRA